MGYLLALTGSNTINEYALNKFKADFGEEGAFRLISPEEMRDSEITRNRDFSHIPMTLSTSARSSGITR